MSGNGRRPAKLVQPRESLAQKMARFQRQKDARGVDWSKLDQQLLKGALLAALTNGAALMFSPAQGGRGVCVTLFDEGDKEKLYAIDSTELAEHLTTIVELYTTGAEDYLLAVV